jgi:hypothetical protein
LVLLALAILGLATKRKRTEVCPGTLNR